MEIADEIETDFVSFLKSEIEIEDEFIDESFDEQVESKNALFTKDQENEYDGSCFPRVCKPEKEESDEELPLPCVVTVEEQDDDFEYSESELTEDSPTTTENGTEKVESQGGQNSALISDHSTKVKKMIIKRKREGEIYFCHHCGKQYRYMKSFNLHLQTHCDEESQEVNDFAMISDHSNEMENERNPEHFPCHECGKRYRNMKSYNFHLLTHHNKRSFYCVVCDRAFPTPTDCNAHERSHTEFKCSRCGLVADSLRLLRHHMDNHQNDKIYNCDKCDMKFSFREALKYHTLSHMPEKEDLCWKRYMCDRCGKMFAVRSTLAKHMMKHSDEKGASFECEDCGKKFMSRGGLQFHIQKVHSMHKCDYCEKEYKERRVLLRHIQELHLCVKEHECEFCGASFVRSDRLMEHVRLHTGERPYACNMCDMKYASSSVLRNHKKIIHFGMKLGRKKESDSETEREIPLSELLRRLNRKKPERKGKKNR